MAEARVVSFVAFTSSGHKQMQKQRGTQEAWAEVPSKRCFFFSFRVYSASGKSSGSSLVRKYRWLVWLCRVC